MPTSLLCVTNEGYIDAATKQASAILKQAAVDVAIQIAVALWQRNSSKSIANMQRELAHEQMLLAEQVQAHAVLFWPEEKELVDDAFAIGKVTTTYVGLAGAWGQLVTEAEATGRRIWIDAARKQCFAPSRCEDARWQRNEQLIKADMQGYACRQDEARTQILNDLRYEKQLAVLGLGRGITAQLISYQNIAQSIGLSASSFLQGSINSGLEAFGYYSVRNYSQPVGWAQGIKQTWQRASDATNTYIKPPEVIVMEPMNISGSKNVTVMEPMNISRTTSSVPSKANEIDFGWNSNTANGRNPYYEGPP